MAIGDRINQTVAYHLEKGLPDGRGIDNMVNWYSAIGKSLHELIEAAKQAGKVELRVTVFGMPIKIDIVLPKPEATA